MDLTTWMATVEADINLRTGTADRTWAWAYVIRAIALNDRTSASSSGALPSCGSRTP